MKITKNISNNLDFYNENITGTLFKNYHKEYLNLEQIAYYKIVKNYNSYIYKYPFSKFNFYRTNKKTLNNFLKYEPITRDYFRFIEIFSKFNIKILQNTISTILTHYLDIIEYLQLQDIDNSKLYHININKDDTYSFDLSKSEYNFYNIFKSLFPLNISNIKLKSIYDLININIPKSDFMYYQRFDYIINISETEEYYNDINILIGFITILKNLNKLGNAILYLGAINSKTTADIYVYAKKVFGFVNLYSPEINNAGTPYGTYLILKDYKGCNQLSDFYKLIKDLKSEIPDYTKQFTINDDELRKYYYLDYTANKKQLVKKLNITKPKSVNVKYIQGFLELKETSSEYNDIRLFNNNKYSNYLNYVKQLHNLMATKSLTQLAKEQSLPTKEQIIASILYCRKWGIEYFPYYDKQFNKIEMNEEILNEMYGLLQPLKLTYKTPATFKKIDFTKKNLAEITGVIKHTQKTKKLRASLRSAKSGRLGIDAKSKIKTNNNKKQTMVLDLDLLLRNVDTIEDVIFEVNKRNYGADETELLTKLEDTNLRMHQIMLAIDSRRDFSITDRKLQLAKYYKGNVAFRYFKHTGRKGRQDAAMYIRDKLKNNNVTQAWLKMYEILSDCDIIDPKLEQFNSFHLCEAPGSFIDATNNFIQTKTKIRKFNWNAQSLNVRNAMINDQLGIVKRNRNRWDWGVDNTGDITNLDNLRYYALKYGSQTQKLHLVTSDCGIPMGKPGYYHIAFSSLLAMMYILSEGGSLVYKVLTPIQSPLIWNLIYLCYEYFDELHFFKPVQNAQSREFYIVGKGYKRTPELVKLLELLFKYVEKYDPKADIFNNSYPAPFVSQTVKFMDELGEVFIKAIEKQLYYTDNLDDLSPKFRKMANDYLYEKIEDWLTIYKPKPAKTNL